MNPARIVSWPTLLLCLLLAVLPVPALAVLPGIAIGPPSTTATKAGPVSFTITYTNTTNVTLSPADVTLNTTGTASGTVSVSGSGTATRVVSVGSITGDGTISISIAANTGNDGSNATPAVGPSSSFNVDNTAPAISISPPSASYAKGAGTVTYTVSYNDLNFKSSTLTKSSIQLNSTSGANANVATNCAGSTCTVTLSSFTGNGTLGISVAAGSASDLAGNLAPAAGPSAIFTVDTTVPAVSISQPSTPLTTSGPVSYTITYSDANFQDSTLLTSAKVTLNKTGTAAGVVSVDSSSGSSRTVTISSISGDGTLGISVASGSATDLAGNTPPTAGPSTTFNVDNSGPAITVSAPSATITSGGAVSYTVSYNDPNIGGITLGPTDITVNRTGTATGTVTGVSGTGNSRTITIGSISGNGTLGITIVGGTATDILGNLASATAASATFTVDDTPPVIAISAPSATAANSSSTISYTVTYGDNQSLKTIALAPANVQLITTGTATGTVTVAGTTGNTRTITISSISGDGTLGIAIAAGTASDQAGNTAPGAVSATFNVSATPPAVTISAPSVAITATGPVTYTITYSDSNFLHSSGLTQSKITLNKSTTTLKGTVTVDSGSGPIRTVTISSISGSGDLGISLAAGTATDTAGNLAPAAGPSINFNVDTISPKGAVTYTPAGGSYKAGDQVTINAAFDKPLNASPPLLMAISGANVLSGTAMTRVDATHYTYTYTVAQLISTTATGSGTATVTFSNATDAVGNTVATAPVTGGSFTVAKSPQTITFAAIPARLVSDAPFSLTATASSGLPVTYTVSDPKVATIAGTLVTPVGAGTATITATQAGNALYTSATASQPLVVSYGAIPPALTVSSLPDGSYTSSTTLNVSGTITCPNGIKTLTVGGVAVTVTTPNNFSFSKSLQLKAGSNTIVTVVTDKGGLTATDTRTITLDATKPAFSAVLPADNSKQKVSLVNMSGTVDDATATVQASLNGGPAQAVAMTGNSFSIGFNLKLGYNTIVLTAADLAGNVGSAKRTILYDDVFPALAIISPAEDTAVQKPSIAVAGTVTDPASIATVSVTMDGKSYTPVVAADGSFTQSLTLGANKEYLITATATDQAGNSSTVQRSVFYVIPSSGDLNRDGIVNISDALLALQMAIGLKPYSTIDLTVGDVAPLVNGKPAPDGVLDIFDAVLILEKSVGLKKW